MTVPAWLAFPSRLALSLALPLSLMGCVVSVDRDRDGRSQVGGSSPTSSVPDTPNVTPLRVKIDTDQVMTADPGKGVGVFVEYGTGGNWHVWWTCDTSLSNRTCTIDIRVSSPSGITPVDSTVSPLEKTSTQLSFLSRTSTGVDDARFTTAPGEVLTLEAAIDGVLDPSYIFFVQNGQVNGGYQGALTNPLELQGDRP